MILRPKTTQASSAELLKLSLSHTSAESERKRVIYINPGTKIMVTRRNFARNITRNYTVFSRPAGAYTSTITTTPQHVEKGGQRGTYRRFN